MRTIGAKEFRQKLDKVLDEVLAGQDVIIKHRFKAPVRLQALPTKHSASPKKTLTGLAAFDAAPKRPSPFNSNKTIKQLYHESIAKKHGIDI